MPKHTNLPQNSQSQESKTQSRILTQEQYDFLMLLERLDVDRQALVLEVIQLLKLLNPEQTARFEGVMSNMFKKPLKTIRAELEAFKQTL